ncbi:hypothetical protein GOP47_0030889 [Adiantum capillus-veneris]|nr:hypothetical protein GOP47_0030889 [Adiantum capillus-veneris]
MGIMNSFINDLFEKLAQETASLARYNKKSTISRAGRFKPYRGLFLAKHTASKGTKIVTKFTIS